MVLLVYLKPQRLRGGLTHLKQFTVNVDQDRETNINLFPPYITGAEALTIVRGIASAKKNNLPLRAHMSL